MLLTGQECMYKVLLPTDRKKANMIRRRCQAGIRSNFTDFGDTILGMPFLRSMFTVFEYVDSDMYKVSPRIGLTSRVDRSQAMMHYERVYQNRLH